MVPKLHCVSEAPEGLTALRPLVPMPGVFDSVSLGWGLRNCISGDLSLRTFAEEKSGRWGGDGQEEKVLGRGAVGYEPNAG